MEEKKISVLNKIYHLDPILESFHLYGLHGAKDIKYDAESAASILMARNGAGKTTFLSAINSTLSRRYYKLNDLTFKKIKLRLHGGVDLEISKKDIDDMMSFVKKSSLIEISQDSSVSLEKVLSVAGLASGYSSLSRNLISDATFDNLYRRHPTMSARQLFSTLTEFQESLHQSFPSIRRLDEEVKRALDGVEIVYLPTYRRIEVSLPQEAAQDSRFEIRRRRMSNTIPEDVKFGLSDITDKLKEISTEVQRISNTTYKRISANIVNDLLSGTYKFGNYEEDRPKKDDLELFFSRLKGAQREQSSHFIESDVSIPDIEKIYSNDIDEDARPFLLYFLSNLNTAIQSTKPLEDRVNGFIAACNEYLEDEDSSAYVDGTVGPYSYDSKRININKDDFRPYFTTSGGEKRVPIEALSSGEKQVVSLFARMHLYPKKKIVLYDEPELSLSMSWQAKLLPDVCQAASFAQLIAITHSPFTFDNELDEFADNLLVSAVEEEELDKSGFDFDIDELFAELDQIDLESDEGK